MKISRKLLIAAWPLMIAEAGAATSPAPEYLESNQLETPSWDVEYGSCSGPYDSSWDEICGGSRILFDGSAKTYGVGQTWDTSQSTVKPIDGKLIRFELNNVHYWGAAAYVFNRDFSYLDLSQYSRLRLQLKNSSYGSRLAIQIFLVDMNRRSESVRLPFSIDQTYQNIVLNLAELERKGFPLCDTQALVIAVSEPKKQSYFIDIAKISVD